MRNLPRLAGIPLVATLALGACQTPERPAHVELRCAEVDVAAAANPEGWDPQKAADLARNYADEVNSIRVAFQKQPGAQGATGSQRERILENLRRLRLSTRHLAAQLRDCKGRDETLGIARQVGRQIRDLRTSASGAIPSYDMQQRVDQLNQTLEQLAALYGVTVEEIFRQTPGTTPATPSE